MDCQQINSFNSICIIKTCLFTFQRLSNHRYRWENKTKYEREIPINRAMRSREKEPHGIIDSIASVSKKSYVFLSFIFLIFFTFLFFLFSFSVLALPWFSFSYFFFFFCFFLLREREDQNMGDILGWSHTIGHVALVPYWPFIFII